jgi:uncharacterized membrane protein required for colicin V production
MSTIDTISLTILGFSLLIGGIQGFTREVLRIITWGSATAAAYYGHYFLEPFLAPFVTKGIFLKAISSGCLFLLVLIFLNMLSHSLVYTIRSSIFKGVDSSLGMLLGGLRGGFLLTLLYVIFLSFNPSPTHLRILQKSRVASVIEWGILETSSLYPKNSVLKNVKDLILKQQKELLQKEKEPSSSLSISPPHTEKPVLPPYPPVGKRSFSAYVKDFFETSIDEKNPAPSLAHPHYSANQKNELDQLMYAHKNDNEKPSQ